MNIVIRNEIESDVQAISEITRAAFENHPYSHGTEEFIVTALRNANALTISLVAVAGERVVGHAAFSPVAISDGSPGWYGLGPISVLPELQRQGIGKSLMREGLSALNSLGAKGCVAVGDPATTSNSVSEACRSWLLTAYRRRTSLHCHSRKARLVVL